MVGVNHTETPKKKTNNDRKKKERQKGGGEVRQKGVWKERKKDLLDDCALSACAIVFDHFFHPGND